MSVQRQRDLIERDFLDALVRISAGKPRNPTNKRLAAKGKLNVSIAAVAREAGRSRTLIGHDECEYPLVRRRILGQLDPSPNPRNANYAIARLREERAGLAVDLKRAQAQIVVHFHARRQAEQQADQLRKELQRLTRLLANSRQVVQLVSPAADPIEGG